VHARGARAERMDFSGLNNNPEVFDTSANRREDPEIEVGCPNRAQLWRVLARGVARRAKFSATRLLL
jgi:hypothetical protein